MMIEVVGERNKFEFKSGNNQLVLILFKEIVLEMYCACSLHIGLQKERIQDLGETTHI